MDSRTLTTTATISQRFDSVQTTATPIVLSVATSSASSAAEIMDSQQAKFDAIANQATNLGHGLGVALRKAIDRGTALCKSINGYSSLSEPGFFDYFFSTNKLHTFINDVAIRTIGSTLEKDCLLHVEEMKEDLERLSP